MSFFDRQTTASTSKVSFFDTQNVIYESEVRLVEELVAVREETA